MPSDSSGLVVNEAALKTVNFIQHLWEGFTIDHPFEYRWMDEEFDKLFAEERKTGQLLLIFSFHSIFVTCLGLLGLISYATAQRTREIGIRKIMGESVRIVMRLLLKEMINLLIISSLISIPAYFGVKSWLRKFAFHINFQVGVFLLVLAAVTIVVLILAILKVSYHSYRAATSNPADSLRME